jgi:hypothetical protein
LGYELQSTCPCYFLVPTRLQRLGPSIASTTATPSRPRVLCSPRMDGTTDDSAVQNKCSQMKQILVLVVVVFLVFRILVSSFG